MRALIARALHPIAERSLGEVTLQPHQAEGAERLRAAIREFGGALLADEVGLGKTYTALAVARDYQLCTVVAPAVLREMWTRAGRQATVGFTFISHEQLSRGVLTASADIVVVDEAHHARNPTTSRYAALARLCAGAHVLLLSATPVHNADEDLVTLYALFLGSRARHLRHSERERLAVRRRADDLRDAYELPTVAPVEWLPVPPAPDVLRALCDIPPPLPTADGGAAPALFTLSLVRLWASSDAAVRSALRRLVARALAFTALLAEGRLPTRKEFRAWHVHADGVQLAFSFESSVVNTDVRQLQQCAERHLFAVRHALAVLDAEEQRVGCDASRASRLRRITTSSEGPVVAFTQFEATARTLYARLRPLSGVALCSGRGARLDGHAISRRLLLRALGAPCRPLDPDPETGDDPLLFPDAALVRRCAPQRPPLPVRLLITTDLLSEGVDLQRASHLVHLDLPWTPARLEQRLGRLRRAGAAFARVRVSAFALPDAAERVLSIVKALQRKALAVSRFTGSEELLQGAPWTVAPDSEDGAVARERLLAAIQEWSRPGAVLPTTATAFAVVGAPVSCTDWAALALVEEPGHYRLLHFTATAVSGTSSMMAARLGDFTAPDACVELPTGVVTAWERWRSLRRGRALVAPAPGVPGALAQGLLRRLQRNASVAPRGMRHQWSEALGALRHALEESHGAHVDRLIEERAAALRRAPTIAPDDVRLIAEHLRGLASTGASTGDPMRLVALLVSVPSPLRGA